MEPEQGSFNKMCVRAKDWTGYRLKLANDQPTEVATALEQTRPGNGSGEWCSPDTARLITPKWLRNGAEDVEI